MIMSQLFEIVCLSIDLGFVGGETKLIVKSHSDDELVISYAK